MADQQGQGLFVPDFLQSRVSPCITHRMGATSRMGEVDVFLNYLAVNFLPDSVNYIMNILFLNIL